MRKNILYISYYFPPHTGGGIQRPFRLVNKLCEDNHNVFVISAGYKYVATDDSFTSSIHKKTKIFYMEDVINNIFWKYSMVLLSKAFTFFSFPDRMIFWYFFNRSKILKIVKDNNIEIVITSSFPFSSHLFGNYLKMKHQDIFWIIDYRDAWSNNPSIIYNKYKPILWKFSKYLERRLNNRADRIMTVSDPLVEDIITDELDKIKVIYNGYNILDFNNLKQKTSDKYTVFYMGSLYSERNPNLFLEPFKIFLKMLGSNDLSLIRFVIIGNSHPDAIKFVQESLGLKIELEIKGYIPHDQVLQIASEASVLLLLIDTVPGSKGIATGKIFEYINLFAPILAIVPLDGVAAKIISCTNTGLCIDPENKDGIIDFLKNDFIRWKTDPTRNIFNKQKNYDEIKSFSSESLYLEFKKRVLNI